MYKVTTSKIGASGKFDVCNRNRLIVFQSRPLYNQPKNNNNNIGGYVGKGPSS